VRAVTTTLTAALILTALTGMAPENPARELCGPCLRATEALRTATERARSGDSLAAPDWLYLAIHHGISQRVCQIAMDRRFQNVSYVVQFDSLLIDLLPEVSKPPVDNAAMGSMDEVSFLYEMVAVAQVRTQHHILDDCKTLFARIGCPDSSDWMLILHEAIEPAIEEIFTRAFASHPELGTVKSAVIGHAKNYVGEMRQQALLECCMGRIEVAGGSTTPPAVRPSLNASPE
jgi:hypothetical protein